MRNNTNWLQLLTLLCIKNVQAKISLLMFTIKYYILNLKEFNVKYFQESPLSLDEEIRNFQGILKANAYS